MTELHARVDILEGELPRAMVGASAALTRRTFAILTLMRRDGTAGVGEASPLPGYSPDSIAAVGSALRGIVESPLHADPLATPFDLLRQVFEAHPIATPAARFALETALLDWLAHNREEPLHQLLAGEAPQHAISVADLVMEADPSAWPEAAEALLADGATHLKLKIGVDVDRELAALHAIREAHPHVPMRVDGNGRVSLEALRRHAGALEALELELVEEPVARGDWTAALDLPLPFALDETLRDSAAALGLLDSGRIRAVVLKPTVLGGLRASFEWAERAAEHGADCVVSHTFEGPIARAASAELALALHCRRAVGLGLHPGLDLWPPHETAAIVGRTIVPHDIPGLGLHIGADDDA